MANSGFDTLNSFKTDLTIKPISPIQPLPNVQGGTFTVTDPQQQAETQAKDEINMGLAEAAVDQTPIYNQMALNYADKFLPVRQSMDENQSMIAQNMGLGERVSFEDALSGIQEQLGPLPQTKGVEKSINFLVDSINARTPYKGAAGIFDVLAQATGSYLKRESAEKAAKITHNLKMKELAIGQMQAQNAAILEKEADFFLKKMNMDNEYLMKNLSFDMDMQKKLADFDIDTAKEKQKAALDLYKNPDRLFDNITFTDPETGQPVVSTSMKVFNPEKGVYEFMLPRLDEKGDTVFDIEAPPGFYLSPLDSPQTDAALSTGVPNFTQASNLIGDFSTLGRAGDIVQKMLTIDEDKVARGENSPFGAEGLVDFFKKESTATFGSFMNAISPGLGDQLTQEGGTLRNKDKIFYPDIDPVTGLEAEEAKRVTFQAPRDGIKIPILTSDFKPVDKLVKVDDYFKPITYTSLGYDDTYAKLKVQENLIVYALARALKPTGRLNVDDINRASQLVNLQGFKSPDFVRGQLGEILTFIRQAQVDIYGQGSYAGGEKNVFDAPQYKEDVTRFKQFLGELPPPQQPSSTTEQDVQQYDSTDQPQENEFVLEPEDLMGAGA